MKSTLILTFCFLPALGWGQKPAPRNPWKAAPDEISEAVAKARVQAGTVLKGAGRTSGGNLTFEVIEPPVLMAPVSPPAQPAAAWSGADLAASFYARLAAGQTGIRLFSPTIAVYPEGIPLIKWWAADRLTRHQVLLRPLPEPEVAIFISLGALAFLWQRRRIIAVGKQGGSGKSPFKPVPALACWLAGCLISAGGAGIGWAVPEIAGNFWKVSYDSLLPEQTGAASGILRGAAAAAGLGERDWLVSWLEPTGPAALAQALGHRLVARRVPAGFEQTDAAIQRTLWDPSLVLAERADSSVLVSGKGGAWAVWNNLGEVRAKWVSRVVSEAADPELVLLSASDPASGVSGLRAVGDGATAWILWRRSGENQEGLYSGAVLRRGEAIRRFELSLGNTTAVPSLAAADGRCLLAHPLLTYDDVTGLQKSLRVVGVAASGVVGTFHSWPMDADAEFLGVSGRSGGFQAVWSLDRYVFNGRVVLARRLTFEGGFEEGSGEQVVGILPAFPTQTSFFSGSSGFLLDAGQTGTYQVKEDLTTVLMPLPHQAIYTGPGQWAWLEDEWLEVQAPRSGQITARRHLTFNPQGGPIVHLATGYGEQKSPSLAWPERGPQVVAQVSDYEGAPLYRPAITGINMSLGRQTREEVREMRFSGMTSPVQVWVAHRWQYIAYRRANPPTPGIHPNPDPDDVMVVVNEWNDDGSLASTTGPLLLAGGPGSQRAVAIGKAGAGNGAQVVWREVKTNPISGQNLFSILQAEVDKNGTLTYPGIRVVDTGVGELSAPELADSGSIVWKGPGGQGTEVRISRRGNQAAPRVLSPTSHEAVAPVILSTFQSPPGRAFELVAWRDKVSKRIFLVDADDTSTLLPISPAGQVGRAPALAVLNESFSLVAWMATAAHGQQVWIAVTDGRTVSAPRPVMEGDFDGDVLRATGDGQGRVMLAVEHRTQAIKGLQLMILAPLTEQDGGLRIEQSETGLHVNWTADEVFPALPGTLETSTNLRDWSPFATEGNPAGGLPWAVGNQGLHRFYRLKAARFSSGTDG